MKAFLENIAERLIKKYPEKMEGVAVVLPSKRSVVFLKHYLSKLIDKPIFLPQFYSIEEFIEGISGYKVLDNLSLQFYLYQAYLQSSPSATDSFEKFMSWSNMLLHDFNEVDRNLVDAKLIFSNLKDVKELENWNLEDWSFSEGKLTQSQESFTTFYSHIYNWYSNFNELLSENNFAYQGMAYKKAVLNIENINLKWDKVWFVGLNALTTSEQKIIDCLKKKDIARVFWDADEYYYNNKNHEAGDFLRTQRDKWSEIDFDGVGKYYETEKNSFNIIACPKNISQSKVVSEILSSYSEEDLKESKTAIVLADEGMLYPVLNHLPENVKDLNITMGSPIKNTPLFSFMDVIFQSQIRVLNSNTFYYKDVLNIINHPLFIQFAKSHNIISLRNDISVKNKVRISVDFIEKHLKSDLENVKSIFNFWKDSDDVFNCERSIINILREQIKGKKNSIESEIFYSFHKSFTLLKNLIAIHEFKVEVKTIYSIFRQLVSKEVIPFKGEPLKGVQLMGILESRTLDFKNVIILNVNEGVLPKGKTLNSFIPFDMKIHFKMPTYRVNDAVFSYHFYRLLQRAENVNVLYNTETDDFGSGEKSRFITQLLSEYPYQINSFIYGGNKLSFKEEDIIIIENSGVSGQITKWSKYVSPSALNRYNNCSLSFYYHYLAKIRKENEVEEFAEANIIGSAIHEAFDDLYPMKIVSVSDIKDKKEDILKKVEEKFSDLMKGENISEGKNYLSLQIAKKLADNFMKFEENYLKKSNSILNILESEGEFEHKVKINNQDFLIKGKVDRIDEFENQIRIIDYKTGIVNKTDVTISDFQDLSDIPKKGKALQLLVYSYLYLKNNPNYLDHEVIAGNFSFKNLKEGFISVAKKLGNKKNDILITSFVLDEIEEIIKEIINKILTEDFKQTEEISRCEYCDYKSLCNR